MPSNHLILCHPLPSPPSIRVFSSESVLRIRWPKHWSFSFSISPSNEYSELISFRTDWLDLLAIQALACYFLKTVCIVFEINFVHINSHISQRLFSDLTATELPRSELVKIYILKFTPKPSDIGKKFLKEYSLQNH